MEQEEFKRESNANFIHDIEEFSDDQLKDENFKTPTDSKKTTYKEDLPNVNTNNIISTRNTTTNRITPNTQNNNINTNNNTNNNTLLQEKRKRIFKVEEPEIEKYKRIDNLRKIAFFIIMIFFKDFFNERYDLDFDNFNCDEVLGISICHMKNVLNLQIYQLFCYYEEYKEKILSFIKNAKLNERAKNIFYYFMTRTYKELYKRCVSGNRDFPLYKKEDKFENVKINKFITLKKAIEERREKLENKDLDNRSKKATLNAFENLCKNMISDIENGKNEKGPQENKKNKKNKKEFKPEEIEIFKYMRNQFPSDEELSKGMELEEES